MPRAIQFYCLTIAAFCPFHAAAPFSISKTKLQFLCST